MVSGIHILRFAIVAAFAFTSLHAAEPTKPAAPATVVTATTVPTAAPLDASEIINLRKQADDSARDKAIAEAKLEVISAGTGRMEVVIGAFGILITLLLAAFGFATYRQAASAATKAVEEEFKSARTKLATLLKAAEETSLQISQKHREVLALSESLQAEINRLPNSEQTPQIDEAGQVELTKAATVVSEKPLKERTAQDFRILMYEAAQAANWRDYFKLAEAMAILHSESPEDLAFALFGKAYAADKLDDHMMAARFYEDYLTRCSNDIPSDRATALVNWGLALSEQAKTVKDAEANTLFTEAGEKFASALGIDPNKHKALGNWGAALLVQASRTKGKARAALLAQSEEKLLEAGRLSQGYGTYNLACLYALRVDPKTAAEWLIISKDQDVRFPGCTHIANESDFDAIRDTPEFKAALTEIGC